MVAQPRKAPAVARFNSRLLVRISYPEQPCPPSLRRQWIDASEVIALEGLDTDLFIGWPPKVIEKAKRPLKFTPGHPVEVLCMAHSKRN